MARFRYIGRHAVCEIRCGGVVFAPDAAPGVTARLRAVSKQKWSGVHPERAEVRKSLTVVEVDDADVLTLAAFRTHQGLDGKRTFQELP